MNLFEFNLALPITDPTWVFFLVLIIILFAPMILGRLHIPHIIGMILAGVLIGEHGFHVLDRDSSFELFGKVGLYYIMFLAGLEMDMEDFKKNRMKSVVFGLLTFLIPMALGIWSSMSMLGYGFLTAVLLASMYASHTLIAYPIISRYGLSRLRSVNITIGGTAITVTLALIILAVIGGMFKGTVDGLFWVFLVAKVAFLGFLIIFFFPRIGRWFFRKYDDSVMQFVFVLAMVFLGGGLMEFVGMEGILGSFPCRIGPEPLDSSCLSADEPSGICGKCLVHSLLSDRCRYDYRCQKPVYGGRSIESGGSHDSGSYFQQMACRMDHAEDLPYAAQ